MFDTSTIIDAMEEGVSPRGSISVICLLEVLRGISSEKRAVIKELLEESHVVYQIENEIVLKYCEVYNDLKQTGMLIPDSDLIIGCTAIVKNRILKTKDQHFRRLVQFGLLLD